MAKTRSSLFALAFAAMAPAQSVFDLSPQQDESATAEPAPPAEHRIHGSLGAGLTTAYLFRGILQEKDGVIAQPWFEFDKPLYAGGTDEVVRSIDLVSGSWNSLHDGDTGSGGGHSVWYEHDFYAKLRTAVAERWRFDAIYTAYYSPNGLFATVQEVGGQVAFDDAGLYGEGFGGLQPSMLVTTELSGQADRGTVRGTYLEFALAPSLQVGVEGAQFDVTLPLTVGVSLHDYYEDAGGDDSTFGFADLGVVLGQSSDSGAWRAEVGVHALWLGDNNKVRNGGDGFEVVASFSLATEF